MSGTRSSRIRLQIPDSGEPSHGIRLAELVTFCILACLDPGPLRSQSLFFKDYSTQDGLPDSRVAPIMQDSRGYLWFGTQAGLTRYDGREFVNFGPAHEIPGIFGRSIAEDHVGAIWYGYTGFHDGGITRIWNGNVDVIDHQRGLRGTQVFQIAEDRTGDLWAATNAGLEHVHFTDSLRKRWTVATQPDSAATGVYAGRNGMLYYATRRGLYILQHDSLLPIYEEPDTTPTWHVRPYSFYESHEGDLWLGGYSGAYLLRGGHLLKFGTESGLPEKGVWCYREDAEGHFFAGTMEGLYRVRQMGDQVRFIKDRSFGDAVVYDMCLDREGNLWLATVPGLRRLLHVGERSGFRGEEFLSTAGIGPIEQNRSGTAVYFGSRNAGLYVYHSERVEQPLVPLSGRALTITSVVPENDSTFWLGLWGGGALHLHGHRRLLYSTGEGLPSNNVHALAFTRSGSIMVGTAAGPALIDTNGTVIPLQHPLLQGRAIFDLERGGGDTLWAGTDDGPRSVVIANNRIADVAALPPASGFTNLIVYSVLRDSRKRMWFGTDGKGAVCFDGASASSISTEDGLASNRVYALAEDSLGNIWVGTASGLSCFDGSTVRNLLYDQGFGEIGMHGLMTDREGYLWVSNYPAVARIKPVRFRHSQAQPPLYLTEVMVESNRLDMQQTADLPPDAATITFRYAALSFTDERNVRYRYILDGFDKSWSPPVPGREVRYTHLPAGKYRFRVKGRSGEGVWTTAPAEFAFSILPPIWARWWFRAATLLLAAGSIYGAYRYRLSKLLQLERTRNRIAMDLHDDIGSTLTRMSVMTEVAQRQITDDRTAIKDFLAKMGDTSRDLIESLGDIVWTVDPKHDDLQNVIRRIVQFGQEVCEGRNISFETELAGTFDSVKLTPEQRRDVYLVFKEGINNLVKHSGATKALFTVKPAGKGVRVELSDNGRGIAPGAEGTGHGLISLRERGSRAGTQFSLESPDGSGTRLSLEIKTG